MYQICFLLLAMFPQQIDEPFDNLTRGQTAKILNMLRLDDQYLDSIDCVGAQRNHLMMLAHEYNASMKAIIAADPPREVMSDQFEAVKAQYIRDTKAVLTPAQQDRLLELVHQENLRSKGNSYSRYLLSRDGDGMNLTEKQTERIAKLRDERHKQIEAEAKRFAQAIETLVQEEQDQALELLSVQQRERLKTKFGEPHEVEGHPGYAAVRNMDSPQIDEPRDNLTRGQTSDLLTMLRLNQRLDSIDCVGEQRNQLLMLYHEHNASVKAIIAADPPREMMSDQFEAVNAQYIRDTQAVLTPAQQDRLLELVNQENLRSVGNSYSRYLSKFGDELKLTEKQNERIAKLSDEQDKKIRAEAQRFAKAIETLVQQEQDQVLELLSVPQRERLQTKFGDPYEVEGLMHPAVDSALWNFR